jgi:hypothetical protein
LGLTIAQSVLEANQPRNSPTQVIVLVTDGASTEGVDPIETAKAYKDAGTIIFTVGVGADIKESEVKGIASDPTASHYFKADEFAKLGDICLQIAASTCMADVGGCI